MEIQNCIKYHDLEKTNPEYNIIYCNYNLNKNNVGYHNSKTAKNLSMLLLLKNVYEVILVEALFKFYFLVWT